MSNAKRVEKGKRNPWAIVLVAVLVVMIMVSGCAQEPNIGAPGTNEKLPENLVIGDEGSGDNTTSDVEIETAYGTLYYPGQWAESLSVEKVELDFGMDVLFFANVEGERYWLFTLHFGGADGLPVGVLETAEGYAVDVTLEISEYIPEDSWTAEQKDLFGAMQEAMNYVVNRLSKTPGFVG